MSNGVGLQTVGTINWTRLRIESVWPNLHGDREGLRRLYVQEAKVSHNAVMAWAKVDTDLPEVKGRNRPHINVLIYVEAVNQACNLWATQYFPDFMPLRRKSRSKPLHEVVEFPPPPFYELRLDLSMVGRLRTTKVIILGEDNEMHETEAKIGIATSEIFWKNQLVYISEDHFVLVKKLS